MRDGAAEGRAANSTGAKMEFFLSVAFLINDVERRFHYQYDSFQECNQAREAIVKHETRHPLWATCTSGKAPPPSVYQKEFQDQLMPGNFLKERRR
jgi:hypothetical protein